jgi:hypothetical protein
MALTTEFQSVMDAVAYWNANLDPTQFSTQLIQLVTHKEKVAKSVLESPSVGNRVFITGSVAEIFEVCS